MGPRAGIILQARMASERLPGKALALVRGRSILEYRLRRLVASGAAQVVLATTSLSEDDALAAVAEGVDVPVFRGDSADVLDRFVCCAREFRLEQVVRATADNPGVDIEAPGRVLAVMRQEGAEYVREAGLPYGAAVEGVATEALARAAILSRDASDREHVTTFIRRRHDLFRAIERPALLDLIAASDRAARQSVA
jgi:spore coat polysaccharide biosynthesis protein SpsF